MLTPLLLPPLFNPLFYFLLLINPNNINPIPTYLFPPFSSPQYHHVIIITIIPSLPIILLFLIQKPIKLFQVPQFKTHSLPLNLQQVTYILLIVPSIITPLLLPYLRLIRFIPIIIPQLITKFYCPYQIPLQILFNIIVRALLMIMADFIPTTIIQPIQ
ncbi:iron chelate uptake ABC transporter family permease subunit, partial [Staphylococcus epidermidis]|uniref:iron chelate uptake ABC transporter family permease subunit n=1 Tax=Staphylococcus epidermidis TaxID=1282 RepID=UPI0021B389C1